MKKMLLVFGLVLLLAPVGWCQQPQVPTTLPIPLVTPGAYYAPMEKQQVRRPYLKKRASVKPPVYYYAAPVKTTVTPPVWYYPPPKRPICITMLGELCRLPFELCSILLGGQE